MVPPQRFWVRDWASGLGVRGQGLGRIQGFVGVVVWRFGFGGSGAKVGHPLARLALARRVPSHCGRGGGGGGAGTHMFKRTQSESPEPFLNSLRACSFGRFVYGFLAYGFSAA